MVRLAFSGVLAVALFGSLQPGAAGTSASVLGGGVGCAAAFIPGCWQPNGWFTIEAREPGEGSVLSVADSGEATRITLDCVVVEQWETQGASFRDVLFGAGVDLSGARWYVGARQGGGSRSYLSLSQHDPGAGPCGALTGLTPMPSQVAHFVFVRN